MRILAIDTTLARCSVAVWDSEDSNRRYGTSEPMLRGHAERLAGLLADTLNESGISLGTLDRIAVTVGPGTFTGVRIGLAFARGLALALGIPVIGITTLRAIAASLDGNESHAPVAVR